VLFLCTDNFTRSIIAEYCFIDFLRKNPLDDFFVSSAGIRADSDISKYSTLHFEILKEMGIDTTEWSRTAFREECFEEFELIIGMSELHKDYIKQKYSRDILLFNEIYNGQNTPVSIGAPDSENFEEQMRLLVHYFHDAMPELYKNIKELKGEKRVV